MVAQTETDPVNCTAEAIRYAMSKPFGLDVPIATLIVKNIYSVNYTPKAGIAQNYNYHSGIVPKAPAAFIKQDQPCSTNRL